MTRAEATRKLAEKVMRWPITHEWDGRVGVGETRVTVTDHTVEGRETYDPWTNTTQALALAEAWCNLDPDHRAFVYEFAPYLRKTRRHYAGFRTEDRALASSRDDARAAALTGAVCKAMGWEVKDAQ